MNNILECRSVLKKNLRSRERLFAGWVSYAHPSITETFSRAEFDFMAIDMEHSTISIEQAQRIIAASQAEGVPCLPRPVSQSNDWFKPLLESGADGLLVQMVNTPEEVEAIIGHLKYPPLGNRSYGVNRAQWYGFDLGRYTSSWNESSILIIQIESIQAVENIEALVHFDEVDGVMIGPYDISGSLGVPGQLMHPLVVEASKEIIGACERSGKSCGTQVSDPSMENISALFELGHTFAVLGSDLFVLWNWAEKMRGLIELLRK